MLTVGMGVVQMQNRDLLRLFIRRDPFGRFFHAWCMSVKNAITLS